MKHRRLGRTELVASEIGLGTAELGMAYGIPAAHAPVSPSRHEAERIVNRALDLGINFIDTARTYGNSEIIIGDALKGRRNKVILASKVQCGQKPASQSKSLRDCIVASVHESLNALQTDMIDLMQLHSATVDVIQSGEAASTLQELQRAGHIRFLGATVYGEEAAIEATHCGTYDCIQVAYSLLDRAPERRVFAATQTRDIGVIVRSVLLKGALTDRYRYLPDRLKELKSSVEQIGALAAEHALSLQELAYRFVLRQPAVSTALVGAASVEELEAAVSFSSKSFPNEELLAEIEAVRVARPEQLNPSNWGIP